MKIRFLLDENLPPRFKSAILRFHSEIDVLRVGDPSAPPLGTQDPEILHYLESSKRLFVTDNRKSIPGHLEEHWAAGGRIWGLFWLRPHATMGQWAKELFTVWEASEAEEWIDFVICPLSLVIRCLQITNYELRITNYQRPPRGGCALVLGKNAQEIF